MLGVICAVRVVALPIAGRVRIEAAFGDPAETALVLDAWGAPAF
jgi:hypothetical protein